MTPHQFQHHQRIQRVKRQFEKQDMKNDREVTRASDMNTMEIIIYSMLFAIVGITAWLCLERLVTG